MLESTKHVGELKLQLSAASLIDRLLDLADQISEMDGKLLQQCLLLRPQLFCLT